MSSDRSSETNDARKEHGPSTPANAAEPPAPGTEKTTDSPTDVFGASLAFHAWDGECASCEDPALDEKKSPATGESASSSAMVPTEIPPTEGQGAPPHLPMPVAPPPTAGKEEDDETGRPMSLMEHLTELRSRLIKILIVIFLGFFACFSFAAELFDALVKPLAAVMPAGSKLIYTALPEAFFVQMKVSFVASVFLTSPYIFYQIWAFVAPGLYDTERRFILPLAAFSAFFFLSGAAFCYLAVFPVAFDFFMSFATDSILPMPSLDEYLAFALKLLLAFGLIFEMPLFAFFLSRMGILTAQRLRAWRRYAILAIFIAAAILTPPDVVSQLLMAAPMLLLYEISIWVAAAAHKPGADKNTTSTQNDKTSDTEAGQESA